MSVSLSLDTTVPIFNDDDEDFPALGCGRGVLHAPKQSNVVKIFNPLNKMSAELTYCN